MTKPSAQLGDLAPLGFLSTTILPAEFFVYVGWQSSEVNLDKDDIFEDNEIISSGSYFIPLTALWVFKNNVRKCHQD